MMDPKNPGVYQGPSLPKNASFQSPPIKALGSTCRRPRAHARAAGEPLGFMELSPAGWAHLEQSAMALVKMYEAKGRWAEVTSFT
jgi:hypothetical protein